MVGALNQVEIEFSVLSRQCLERRIADVQTLSQEISLWESDCPEGTALRAIAIPGVQV